MRRGRAVRRRCGVGTARSAQQVSMPGGSFDDVKRETIYEPFRKETGIEIVPVGPLPPRS